MLFVPSLRSYLNVTFYCFCIVSWLKALWINLPLAIGHRLSSLLHHSLWNRVILLMKAVSHWETVQWLRQDQCNFSIRLGKRQRKAIDLFPTWNQMFRAYPHRMPTYLQSDARFCAALLCSPIVISCKSPRSLHPHFILLDFFPIQSCLVGP